MRFSLSNDKERLNYSEAVELLKGDQAQREAAITALASIGGRKAVMRLLSVIETEDYVTRLKAVDALAIIGRETVGPLIKALEEGLWHVRECAALALGKIGDPRSVKSILLRLRDENIGVRQATEEALRAFLDSDLPAVARVLGELDLEEREELLLLVSGVDEQRAVELREHLSSMEPPSSPEPELAEPSREDEEEVKALRRFRKTIRSLSTVEEE